MKTLPVIQPGCCAPGAEPLPREQAEVQLRALAREVRPEVTSVISEDDVRRASVAMLRDAEAGPLRGALWLLFGAAGLVLLIACTNVSNLLLVRATVRQRELALRVALGAGTWRILRQWLTESLLLALLSAGMGVLLAAWGLNVIKLYGAGELPRIHEVKIDLPVLTFTIVMSVLTALVFSVLPAIKASRPDINEVLKAGAKTATSTGSAQLGRDSLVGAEVALGLVLLIGAGLMMRSFASLTNVHPGFDPNNVLTARITLDNPVYDDDTQARRRYVSQTLERLNALPDVEGAALVDGGIVVGGAVHAGLALEQLVTRVAGLELAAPGSRQPGGRGGDRDRAQRPQGVCAGAVRLPGDPQQARRG